MNARVSALPFTDLPASAAVDGLRLAAGLAEVIRTRVLRPDRGLAAVAAARAVGFAAAVDDDGYIAIGFDELTVERLLTVDASSCPHEAELGALLGYPACCVSRVDREGERQIDRLASQAAGWTYSGSYWAIDPGGYLDGRALISHVPCSASCAATLDHAHRALRCLAVRPLYPWEAIWRWASVRANQ